MIGLRQVAQHVDDLDRATAFYRDMLGLRFMARFDPPGLAFFDLGGTRLLLEAGAPSAILYLEVDDIEASVRALREKDVEVLDDPHCIHVDTDGIFGPAGNEEWMAFLRDSERNLVGLVQSRPPSG
jgi:methylmalonyl-CoA/ethylmalonyl-CoA epimerase